MLAQEKKRDNRSDIAANTENTQLLNYLQLYCGIVSTAQGKSAEREIVQKK